jgi:hypothetical protein
MDYRDLYMLYDGLTRAFLSLAEASYSSAFEGELSTLQNKKASPTSLERLVPETGLVSFWL